MIDTSHTHLHHLCTERHCTPLAPVVYDLQGNAGHTIASSIEAALAASQSTASALLPSPPVRVRSQAGVFACQIATTHPRPSTARHEREIRQKSQGTVQRVFSYAGGTAMRGILATP